jgi:hypothetical protein
VKRIGLIVFILLMFTSSPISAAENLYYNEDLEYSLKFPSGWSVLTPELKDQLSPDEKENTIEIFIQNFGEAQMYINHHPESHFKFKATKEIIDYAENTPEKERDYTIYLNDLQTKLGMKIENIQVDTAGRTITLVCSQTSSNFGKMKEIIHLSEHKEHSIEFHFYLLTYTDQYSTEVQSIIQSIESSTAKKQSKIKEGSFNYDENKQITEKDKTYDHQKSPLSNFLMKIANPIYWIAGICLFVLWTIAYFVLKRY